MKTRIILFALLNSALFFAQTDTTKVKVPFEGQDQTWQNGSDRRTNSVLTTKYFTGSVMIDANYTHSFNNPNDNTVVGSTALARNNENASF
jgi:hypothetical protein